MNIKQYRMALFIVWCICLCGCNSDTNDIAPSGEQIVVSYRSTFNEPLLSTFNHKLKWLREVKQNEIRMSWFDNKDLKISYQCKADLFNYEVMTVRDTPMALQNSRKRQLSHAQALTLTELRNNLPKSTKPKELSNLVIVSVGRKEIKTLHIYDRSILPPEIVRLYDLTGAYITRKQ